jgi:hypothetical protein
MSAQTNFLKKKKSDGSMVAKFDACGNKRARR